MGLKSFLGVVLGVLLAAGPAVAADQETLTFEVFSRRVMAYYPGLKAAHRDVDIALAKQMQAQAGFWPSLDLSAGYRITNDPVDVFGMRLRQERFTASDFDLKRLNSPSRHQDLSAGAHVEWPLFDAMQTIQRARLARENVKASQADEAFTQMEALLMAQDAYLNAVMIEQQASVIDGVQKNSDQDLQKAKDLKDKGMILGADYFSARVMFGDFTRMKNELARQRTAMMTLLNILMGESPGHAWALPDTLKDDTVPLEDQTTLLAQAMANRADITAMNARVQAAEAELSRENATGLPSAQAFGDAVNDTNTLTSAGGNNYTLGVKAVMPLFDPARAGRAKEARARKEQMQHSRDLLIDSIARDITAELARSEAYRDNIAVLKGMMDDAKEAVALVVPLYSEGRKSIADLLEVRRSSLQAAQAYSQVLTGVWQSQARLLFLTGRLTETEMLKLTQGAGL